MISYPSVSVVSHCWAVRLPHYASLLRYHLSSFLLHPPVRCRVIPVVCHDPNDELTVGTLRFFADRMPLAAIPLPPELLGRRSIGRNKAALFTEADRVWFSDVDQVFGDGLLDGLVDMEWPSTRDGDLPCGERVTRWASMIFPRTIQIHRDHQTGDEYARRVIGPPGIVDIDKSDFIDKLYHRAIGGVQIVRGDFANDHGYLRDEERWQRPTNTPFADFRDDIAYRKSCLKHGPIIPVDLPGLFRLRHSTTSYQ